MIRPQNLYSKMSITYKNNHRLILCHTRHLIIHGTKLNHK